MRKGKNILPVGFRTAVLELIHRTHTCRQRGAGALPSGWQDPDEKGWNECLWPGCNLEALADFWPMLWPGSVDSNSDVRLHCFSLKSLVAHYCKAGLSEGSPVLVWLCSVTFLVSNSNVLRIHTTFGNSDWLAACSTWNQWGFRQRTV